MIIRNYMISNSKFVALLFRHSGCPGCLASIAQAAIFRVEDNWQCLSFTLTPRAPPVQTAVARRRTWTAGPSHPPDHLPLHHPWNPPATARCDNSPRSRPSTSPSRRRPSSSQRWQRL